MSLYGTLFRNVLFPAYETALGRSTPAYMREYDRSQWLPRERVLDLQWEKLQALVAHCWAHVPYYRRTWTQLGIGGPQDIRTRADYARLPVLTKPTIRAHFDELISDAHRERLLYKSTGGSTGEPLRFGYTRESYERRVAVMHRGYGWSGARLGQRTLYLWGISQQETRKERLYHRAFNRRMLNAFDLRDERLPGYADAFARFRPGTVVAYVTPLVHMAQWLQARGRRVPSPARILTAAEALQPSQRALLQQVFGCPVHNTYGCREFMLLAAECTHGGLHMTSDHVMLELGASLDGREDGPREVIATDLHNLGMPLLRYANGDLATPGDDTPCACGRGLPTLRSVDGRKLDALRSADGRFIPGEYVVYAFLGAKGVRRYQAVQKTLDHVELSVVRDIDFDPAVVQQAQALLQQALGETVRLDLRYVDEIPPTPTGKQRVTISELE